MEKIKLDNLVSVVSPAYNADKYIEKLIDCVASQSVRVLEHIIINDGSTDETLEVLNRLAKENPHVKVVSQKNQGAGEARNKGIKQSKGKYIAFLDADDFWLSDKLERQLSFMEENSAIFTYGDYTEIEERTGRELSIRTPPEELTYRDLLPGCPIGCLTAAYNQEALGKIYMPDIRRGQDWGLWLAITRNGVVAKRYPGNLARYSLIKGSLSKNKLKKALDVFRIYRQEERLGLFRSLIYLACFALSVLRK